MTITPAKASEWPAAFQLLFRHLGSAERDTRIANGLRLAATGELTPDGIVVVHGAAGLVGAVVCVPLAGAGGLVWPPGVVEQPGRAEIEDQLVQVGLSWLRGRGIKVAQALLAPAEASRAESLQRNGFRYTTRLQYLRHDLDKLSNTAATIGFTVQNYHPSLAAVFHETLLRTYEDTLDCPELNGARTVEEIVAGHQAQGEFDPGRWWLARLGDQPVGVLLATKMFDSLAWDLSYVGVVPQARRRGLARALTQLALAQARKAGASQLNVAVDVRNQPARHLYASLGFSATEQRDVYLALLAPVQ